MRLTFICISDGRNQAVIDGQEMVVYFAEFGIMREKNQRFFGKLRVESIEPMFYKTGNKYTINIGEHSGIELLHDIIEKPENKRNN